MLLIPLPEARKLKKPVQDLIMEARAPFSIFLTGMRTLTQQVYEDHAAACSRAAEQTDDPVFRRMLTVETGRAARGEAGNLLLLGTAEGFRPVSTLLYAMAGRQARVSKAAGRSAKTSQASQGLP